MLLFVNQFLSVVRKKKQISNFITELAHFAALRWRLTWITLAPHQCCALSSLSWVMLSRAPPASLHLLGASPTGVLVPTGLANPYR
jgi:hypothetical protein